MIPINKQQILLGAGEEGERYLNSVPYESVYCFADNNKFGKTLCGKDIISFEQLRVIHHNYTVVLTVSAKYQLQLAKQCGEAGIVCLNLQNKHWRKGCWAMQNQMFIESNLRTCCQTYPITKMIKPSGNWVADYNKLCDYKQSLISKLINGESNDCDGCVCMVYGFYDDYPHLTEIRLGGKFNGEKCNARCIYCSFTKEGNAVLHGNYGIIEPLEALGSIIVQGTDIVYSAAEITISPYKEQFFNFIRDKKLKSSVFFTSAIVFSDEIANILSEQKGRLQISLDCGTKETYKKVKGVDAFNEVKKNIAKYRRFCSNIQLKYIILDKYNDNYKDIDGFLEVAKQFADEIIVSVDYNTAPHGVSDNIINCIKYFIEMTKHLSIKFSISRLQFNKDDYEKISRFMEETK